MKLEVQMMCNYLSYIGQSSSEFESTFDEIGLLQRSLICAMWLNMAAILSDELKATTNTEYTLYFLKLEVSYTLGWRNPEPHLIEDYYSKQQHPLEFVG